MNYDDLHAADEGAKQEIFRLEQQQSYAGVDDPNWHAWQAGDRQPRHTDSLRAWQEKVRPRIEVGLRYIRAIIIERPLNPYLQYELLTFLDAVEIGGEVWVSERDAHPDLAGLTEDYWMYDSEIVAIMCYDEEYRPLGPADPTEPIEHYVAQRDLSLKYAVPLTTWMDQNREILTT